MDRELYYWKMFIDAWALLKSHLEPPHDSNTYFEELTSEAHEFYKKYQSPFALNLEVIILEEIERLSAKGGE